MRFPIAMLTVINPNSPMKISLSNSSWPILVVYRRTNRICNLAFQDSTYDSYLSLPYKIFAGLKGLTNWRTRAVIGESKNIFRLHDVIWTWWLQFVWSLVETGCLATPDMWMYSDIHYCTNLTANSNLRNWLTSQRFLWTNLEVGVKSWSEENFTAIWRLSQTYQPIKSSTEVPCELRILYKLVMQMCN